MLQDNNFVLLFKRPDVNLTAFSVQGDHVRLDVALLHNVLADGAHRVVGSDLGWSLGTGCQVSSNMI